MACALLGVAMLVLVSCAHAAGGLVADAESTPKSFELLISGAGAKAASASAAESAAKSFTLTFKLEDTASIAEKTLLKDVRAAEVSIQSNWNRKLLGFFLKKKEAASVAEYTKPSVAEVAPQKTFKFVKPSIAEKKWFFKKASMPEYAPASVAEYKKWRKLLGFELFKKAPASIAEYAKPSVAEVAPKMKFEFVKPSIAEKKWFKKASMPEYAPASVAEYKKG